MPLYRMNLKRARHYPRLQRRFTEIMKSGVRRDPVTFYSSLTRKLEGGDALLLATTGLREHLIRNFQDVVRQQDAPPGPSLEVRLYMGDWGFEPEQITSPTTLWHRAMDVHRPLRLGERLAARIPHARIQILPDYGVFVIYHAWRQIVQGLAAELRVAQGEDGSRSDWGGLSVRVADEPVSP